MHWVPINGFNGVFDGRGHSVSGLYVKCDTVRTKAVTDRGYGFFGSLSGGTSKNPVVVKNVGVEDSYFGVKDDYDIVGAIVGLAKGGSKTGNSYYEILNSYSTSTVNAVSYPGGIVGVIGGFSNTLIENCYNTGFVEGKHGYAGGLVSSVNYDANVNLVNSYNVGKVVSYGTEKDYFSLLGNVKSVVVATNCYYLKVSDIAGTYGTQTEMEQFEDGSVAYALHQAEHGSIWGQNVGVDPLPNFSGKVKNYPSAESSSSVVSSSSSSSVKSSSSEAKSSSSAAAKSSSSVAESSSSSAAKSSSSSQLEIYCNGKKCSDVVLGTWDAPRFQLMVTGRNLLVTGVRNGSSYAVLDIQGQVLATGRVEGANLSVELPYSGNFLLRVDRQIRRISVR